MTISPDLFAALPDPVLVVDRTTVLWANRRFAELAGTEPARLEGRPLDEVFHAADRDRIARILDDHATKRDGFFRFGIRSKITGSRALDFRAIDAQDGILLLVGHDESDAARMRETVGELSELFLSQGGRAMVDLDTLFEASRPVFSRLGWLVMIFEIQGTTAKLRRVMAPSSAQSEADERFPAPMTREVALEHMPGLRRVVQTRVGYFDDRALDYADATEKWARATGREPDAFAEFLVRHGITRGAWAPALVRDQASYVVGAMGPNLVQHDLAAVQLFASQISATVQIAALTAEIGKQHKLAALGQMSALLAHEVRNPLAVMFQAYRQIRRRVGDKADIGDLMAIVEEEAWRLNHLVDDLVHFAGPIKPRLQDVSLGQLVSWALEGLAADADAPSDKIEIHVDVPADLSPVVADPALLRQAIAHLVSNACAHVRRGGNVWISGEEDAAGHRVRLRVANDGEPLPADVAFRVFEPFFTTKAKGTGLGLAVVRRLVEDQKGKVALDATDQGVSFSMWLPASPPS